MVPRLEIASGGVGPRAFWSVPRRVGGARQSARGTRGGGPRERAMSSQENPAVPASERKANVAVACGFYEAADVPAMLEFVDPQIEWRGPDSLPWRGTFPRPHGFPRFLTPTPHPIP